MTTERSYTAFSGYTKHYFAGKERLASAIGNGGLADIGIVGSEGLADKRRERDSLLRRVMEPYPFKNTLLNRRTNKKLCNDVTEICY